MAPENEEDYLAMHQMRGCGIKSMQMLNSHAEVFGTALRGPLVLELYPESHELPGSMNQSPAR